MGDPIRDELHRLTEEFSKLLGTSKDVHSTKKTSLEQLTEFGLTIDEAKVWLEQEPSFTPTDGSLHDTRNRRRLDRTNWSIIYNRADRHFA